MTQSTRALPATAARLNRSEVGLLIALFCIAALTLGFGLLAVEVLEGDTQAFDTYVAQTFRPAGTNGPILLYQPLR